MWLRKLPAINIDSLHEKEHNLYLDFARDLAASRCEALNVFLRQSRLRLTWCVCLFVFIALQHTIYAQDQEKAGIVLRLTRHFSELEGSSKRNASEGISGEQFKLRRDHDRWRGQRHQRELVSVVDFPIAGDNVYVGFQARLKSFLGLVAEVRRNVYCAVYSRLYYTSIGLGNPRRDYYVQIDTGSDVMWVDCTPCSQCPRQSDLKIPLHIYDPPSSSTSKNSSCMSGACQSVTYVADSECIDARCWYAFGYGDGSTTEGYLVEDTLYFNQLVTNNTYTNGTATVVFGCGFNQTGESLTSSARAVDGIIGFGRQSISIFSQLAEQSLTPNIFAHCLGGDSGEGGIMVIGHVTEPGMVYTPLVKNQLHYNVNLLGISVAGTNLSISPAAFSIEESGGTIFDSGTTLALLTDEAYTPFVNAIIELTNFAYYMIDGQPCFDYHGSNIDRDFPAVTLFFESALMNLKPQNYLLKQTSGLVTSWCLGWSASSGSHLKLSILGDIVLKNMLVEYDVQHSRIGWLDFDCQSSVGVSSGSTASQVSSDQIRISSAHTSYIKAKPCLLILLVIIVYVSAQSTMGITSV